MKVWASASAIGLSMATALGACSSTPTDGGTYVAPTAGTSAGGSGNVAGASPAGGSQAAAGSGNVAGASGGNVGTAAGAGGTTATGGTAAGGASGAVSTTCPPGVIGHCDSNDPTKYPTYTGYTLNLVEDFPAPIDLNNDLVWTWSDGFPNDSQTSFIESAITFANGRMIIKADSKCPPANNNTTCYPPRTYYAESYTDDYPRMDKGGTGVVSGEFRSKYNNYRYGRYEVKLKAPAQPMGNFLSTMFVFRTPTNVAWNEIDIELEANKQGQVNGNTVNAPTGAKGYPGGAAWSAAMPAGATDIATDHIYAFNWTPTSITWYIDNSTTPVHSYDGTGGPAIPTLSAKIMMNLWVFASASAFGDPTKNVYPMTSEYDYFRFYKWSGEQTYPVAGHPTGADYVQSAQNNPKEVGYGQ